jgi:hypothetical protein
MVPKNLVSVDRNQGMCRTLNSQGRTTADGILGGMFYRRKTINGAHGVDGRRQDGGDVRYKVRQLGGVPNSRKRSIFVLYYSTALLLLYYGRLQQMTLRHLLIP